MNIYLIKDGQNAGPYSETEVKARIKSGAYTLNDQAWCEGCTAPVPLAQIFRPSSPRRVIATETDYSHEALSAIAENHGQLCIAAICLVAYLFVPIPESMELAGTLIIGGYIIRTGWRLTRALQRNPWVWVIWSLIPFANLYAVGRILWTSARVLKSYGLPRGFMALNRTVLERLNHSN